MLSITHLSQNSFYFCSWKALDSVAHTSGAHHLPRWCEDGHRQSCPARAKTSNPAINQQLTAGGCTICFVSDCVNSLEREWWADEEWACSPLPAPINTCHECMFVLLLREWGREKLKHIKSCLPIRIYMYTGIYVHRCFICAVITTRESIQISLDLA